MVGAADWTSLCPCRVSRGVQPPPGSHVLPAVTFFSVVVEPCQHFPFPAQYFLFLVTPTSFSYGAVHVIVLHIKYKELQNSFRYKPCFPHSKLSSSLLSEGGVPGNGGPKCQSGSLFALVLPSGPVLLSATCLFECRRQGNSKGRSGFSVFTEISVASILGAVSQEFQNWPLACLRTRPTWVLPARAPGLPARPPAGSASRQPRLRTNRSAQSQTFDLITHLGRFRVCMRVLKNA